MSKFKVGDVVQILPTTPANKNEHPVWVRDMDALRGKSFRVKRASPYGITYMYTLEEDSLGQARIPFQWREDWLLPVSDPYQHALVLYGELNVKVH